MYTYYRSLYTCHWQLHLSLLWHFLLLPEERKIFEVSIIITFSAMFKLNRDYLALASNVDRSTMRKPTPNPKSLVYFYIANIRQIKIKHNTNERRTVCVMMFFCSFCYMLIVITYMWCSYLYVSNAVGRSARRRNIIALKTILKDNKTIKDVQATNNSQIQSWDAWENDLHST